MNTKHNQSINGTPKVHRFLVPSVRVLEQRAQRVEDLWGSISVDQESMPVTGEKLAELDRRLDAYEADGDSGRSAESSLADIRKQL